MDIKILAFQPVDCARICHSSVMIVTDKGFEVVCGEVLGGLRTEQTSRQKLQEHNSNNNYFTNEGFE